MKSYTTIQLNVKVTDDTADQIKRLAASNHITVAEQLRRFIEQGLSVHSYEQNIDLIASVIRQELMSIYHPEDIQNRIISGMSETLKKFENTLRKSGKAASAGYFLLVKVLLDEIGRTDPADFAAMVEQAGAIGVEYMNQKNRTVNEILKDGRYTCRMADESLQ